MSKRFQNIFSESTYFVFSFYFSRGLRIAFAMVTPILVSMFFNQLSIGILTSSGALVAGIGDNPGTIKIKFYTQSVAAIFYFLVVFISQLLLPYTIAFGLWATFCGFFFSMFFIYGSRAVSVGTSALLCLVYACGFENPSLGVNTLFFMLGVIYYGIVSLGLWRIQPFRVAEQKISENIKYLSEYTGLMKSYYLEKAAPNPPKKNKFEDIQSRLFDKQEKIHSSQEDIRENLFKLRINAKSFSAKGRRMALIFSALIDLYEHLISLNLHDPKLISSLENSNLKTDFCSQLDNMQDILNGISWSINLHKKVTVLIDSSILSNLKNQIIYFENTNIPSGIDLHVLKHIRLIFKTFYRQVKIIKSLVNGEFEKDKSAYEDLDLKKFTQKYNYSFSSFKANLNLRSNIFKYALRMSFSILLAYIACALLQINYFCWVFLTIILILKPVYGNTKNFAIDRLKGTLTGGIITLLVLLITQNPYIITLVITISIIGAYSFIPINYKVGVAFVTIFVILLLFLDHHNGNNWTNIYHRIGGTTIAIIIAFIISFSFLPTWEFKVLPMLIGKLLKYNLKYFQKISNNLLNEHKFSDTEIKLSRKDVLLGTSNLSSAFQRVISEPKLSKNYKSDIYNLITLINLLSTRISSLRTYSSQIIDVSGDDKIIIKNIEDILYNCIAVISQNSNVIITDLSLKENDFSNYNESLFSYQLKEIHSLILQIYNYIIKLQEFEEWKISNKYIS